MLVEESARILVTKLEELNIGENVSVCLCVVSKILAARNFFDGPIGMRLEVTRDFSRTIARIALAPASLAQDQSCVS